MRPHNQPPPSSQLPGLLRLLPETLPFYPYRRTDDGRARRPHSNRRSRKNNNLNDDNARGVADPENYDPTTTTENDESGGGGGGCIVPNAPLIHDGEGENPSFTLFFFVDSTNRQSLNAIPKVSQWFRHALRGGGDDDGDDGNYDGCGNNNDNNNNNRVICVPNHPSPDEVCPSREIDDDDDDEEEGPANRAAVVRTPCPMLLYSGFYRMPFLHPQHRALIHLLGVARVPSVVVVGNVDGRIVTRRGWEAIDRELWKLDDWIERVIVEGKKRDDDDEEEDEDGGDGGSSRRRYESYVVGEWGNGNSGLPLYWNLLGWIL